MPNHFREIKPGLNRYQKQREKAEEQAKHASLVKVKHRFTHYEERGFKCYGVLVHGEHKGFVFQSEETTYKVIGRVRFNERKAKRWQYEPHGFNKRVIGLHHKSRQAALVELLLDHLREPEAARAAKSAATRKRFAKTS